LSKIHTGDPPKRAFWIEIYSCVAAGPRTCVLTSSGVTQHTPEPFYAHLPILSMYSAVVNPHSEALPRLRTAQNSERS
jgi:hypothetical protein